MSWFWISVNNLKFFYKKDFYQLLFFWILRNISSPSFVWLSSWNCRLALLHSNNNSNISPPIRGSGSLNFCHLWRIAGRVVSKNGWWTRQLDATLFFAYKQREAYLWHIRRAGTSLPRNSPVTQAFLFNDAAQVLLGRFYATGVFLLFHWILEKKFDSFY